MGEADRHVQLSQALVVELHAVPLPVGGRAPPQVHPDVEDPSPRTADQLGHALAELQVQSPQHPAGRAGVVVLDEGLGRGDPQLLVPAVAIGLHEEAPLVGVDVGLDRDEAGDGCGLDLHRTPEPSRPARTRRRSRPAALGDGWGD